MSGPDTGYAEFNDSHSLFRGIMAGANGTFSGTFDATNVNVVQSINIRDGAVSAYYGFAFSNGSPSITFTVPRQPFAQVVEIIAPVELVGLGDETSPGYINVYRNGVLITRDAVTAPTYLRKFDGGKDGKGRYIVDACAYAQPIRFVDFDVFENQDNVYTISVEQGPQTKTFPPNGTRIKLLGSVVVGFRKR